MRPACALLGGGVVDRGGAEQQGAAHGDGEHQRGARRREAACRRARELAEARKPPTGASAPSGGARTRAATRATTGPRKPTATTRQIAVSSEVAAAVCGVFVVVDTVNSGIAPARASSAADQAPGAEQAGLDGRVAERDGRRHASGPTSGGQDREQRGGQPGGDRRGGRHPVRAHDDVVRGDAVAHERVSERLTEHRAGPDARGRADHGDERSPPTRSCAGSGPGWRRPRAGERSRARAAGSRGPACPRPRTWR